jgi:membrane protease YdiL (CAAX protease family)
MRERFRRLPLPDRLLVLIACCWSIGGIAMNHFWPPGHVGVAELRVMVIQWAAIAGVIAYTVIRREHTLADYGFSLTRGAMWSLAAIGAIHVYLVARGGFDLSTSPWFLWSAMGAFMEEIAFRVILIDRFIVLMDGIKGKAFWAILASSVLFLLPHLPTKTPSQLLGVFTGALFLGYVYYKSRSILLPAWMHSFANAGFVGGLVIVSLCVLVGAADAIIRPSSSLRQLFRSIRPAR